MQDYSGGGGLLLIFVGGSIIALVLATFVIWSLIHFL